MSTISSNLLISETVGRLELITTLSDVSRILRDLQHDETLTRRLILTAVLNPALKETLNATRAGEWLFGDDLVERLKTAKSLDKSSRDLKPATNNAPTAA